LTLTCWCALVGAFFVARSGAVSIWYDELASLRIAHETPTEWLISMRDGEANGVLHHLVLRVVVPLFGDGITAVRLPAVVAWVAGVPMFHALARRLGPRVPALAATVVYSLAPLGLQHGVEARMYSFAATASILLTLAFVRFVEEPSRRRSLVYGLVGALALGTHFMIVTVLAAHLLALTLHPRRRTLVRQGWPAALLVVVAALPVLLVVQRNGSGQIAWIPARSPAESAEVLAALVNLTWLPDTPAAVLLALPAVALVAAGLWWAIRGGRAPDRSPERDERPSPDEAWRLHAVALWAAVPVVGTLLYSWLVQPLLVARYLIVALPPVILLALLGALALHATLPIARRALPIGLALLAALAALPSAADLGDGYYGEDWPAASRIVVDGLRPGDLVVTADSSQGQLTRDGLLYHLDPADRARLDPLVLPTGRLTDPQDPTAAPPADRVWVVQRGAEEPGRAEEVLDALARLDGDFEVAQQWEVSALQVARYQRVE
jgi:mannosyltransferase